MLDPKLWRPRLTLVYNQNDRVSAMVRQSLFSRLTRIEVKPYQQRDVKQTWNKSGDLKRVTDDGQIGQSRQIGWGTSYQVWGDDVHYPYNLDWRPVPWLPRGRVQFWEYVGELSRDDLLKYMQLDNSYQNAELVAQIESLKGLIENPATPIFDGVEDA